MKKFNHIEVYRDINNDLIIIEFLGNALIRGKIKLNKKGNQINSRFRGILSLNRFNYEFCFFINRKNPINNFHKIVCHGKISNDKNRIEISILNYNNKGFESLPQRYVFKNSGYLTEVK